jgi:hypothetical protein
MFFVKESSALHPSEQGLLAAIFQNHSNKRIEEMRHSIIKVLVITGVLLFAASRGVAADPDGTVRITGKSVAAGIGYSWGAGVLTYKGREYPFTITGLSAGDIGVTSTELSGEVFNLKNVDDFNGNYASFNAGVTLAGGGRGATMRNQSGVVMNLVGTTQGVNFELGVDGIKVELKK